MPKETLADLLCQEIEGEIVQINQWKSVDNALERAKAVISLERLVELAEIKLCGSFGGFDYEFGQRGCCNLLDRARHVLKHKERLT